MNQPKIIGENETKCARVHCERPRDNETKLCSRCREINNRSVSKAKSNMRKSRKESGLCIECAKPRGTSSKVYCDDCRRIKSQKAKLYKRRCKIVRGLTFKLDARSIPDALAQLHFAIGEMMATGVYHTRDVSVEFTFAKKDNRLERNKNDGVSQ